MSSPNPPDRELLELVAAFRDETLTSAQQGRLQVLLQRDVEARTYFLRFMTLQGLLETRFPAGVSDESSTGQASDAASSSTLPSRATKGTRPSLLRAAVAMAVALSLLVAITGYLWRQTDGGVAQGPDSTAIATIADLVDVVWMQDDQDHAIGDTISPSHICLHSGMLRLSYRHGVVVTIEGPADYELLTRERAVLHQGRLAAFVPDGAEGFRVATPNANVVDLGTEFGLTVSDGGETELSVFDGKVELTPTAPQGTMRVVESGLACRVDAQGKTHQELIGLAPYRDARDSLARWRIIWDPFGPGSGQKFPGQAGRGWLDAWSMKVQNGRLEEQQTGIFDEPRLFPGTEKYLGLVAIADEDDRRCRVEVTRSFGSIDQFTTAEPYTIEYLLRLDCKPSDVRHLRIFAVPRDATANPSPIWQLEANQGSAPGDSLAWKLDRRQAGESRTQTLAIRRGMTFRCFVEVDPPTGRWRATISNRRVSISSNLDEGPMWDGDGSGPMTLGVEVEGRNGKNVQFSLDAIRIQNRPDSATTTRD